MRNAIHSAVSHLRSQGIWVFLSRTYLSGGALLSSVLLARLMTLEEMGAYRLVMSGINLFSVLALPGAFEVLIRYLPRGEFHIYPYLFQRRIIVALLAAIGFGGFCSITFDHLATSQILSLGLIAAMLPLYFSSQMYEAGYQAQMKFRQLSTIYIGRTSLQLAGFLVAFLIFGEVFKAIATMIFLMTAYHVWQHHRLTKDLAIKAGEKITELRVVNREAWLISIFTILPMVMENIDKILLENNVGLSGLAIYSTGMALGIAVNALVKPFINSINALLVHKTLSMQHYALVAIVGSLIGSVCSLLLPHLIPLLYGASYEESVPIAVTVTMSMGLFLWKTLYFNHALFNRGKKLKVIYFSNMIMSSIVIVYILVVMSLVKDTRQLMLAFAFTYPLKLILSISTIWVFGKVFR